MGTVTDVIAAADAAIASCTRSEVAAGLGRFDGVHLFCLYFICFFYLMYF
jgi:hypothetical protein